MNQTHQNQADLGAQVFTHVCRPPASASISQVSHQRKFASDRTQATFGIPSKNDLSAHVLRHAPDNEALVSFKSADLFVSVTVAMTSKQLRDLARALIDAAADLDSF